MRLGGAVAGAGGALVDLGLQVRVAAGIGADRPGGIVRQIAGEMFPGGAELTTLPAATSYSVVLQPAGQDRMFLHHPGANDLYTASDARLPNGGLVHFGYPPLMRSMVDDAGRHLCALLTRSRGQGNVTSLDMAVVDPQSPAAKLPWREILGAPGPLTDVFSPSIDDLTSAFGLPGAFDAASVERLAGELVEVGYGIVGIMCGERGIYLATGGRERLAAGGEVLARQAEQWADVRGWFPAQQVSTVVSTTGAGDAASAGLLAGIAAGLGPQRTVHLATEVAAARIEGRPLPRISPQS
jgi:sugar/nucleoside kinase (ribokinase family)